MQLIEAMNRKQKKITLFINYWYDSLTPLQRQTPWYKTEAKWEEQYLEWERDVLTEEALAECLPK